MIEGQLQDSSEKQFKEKGSCIIYCSQYTLQTGSITATVKDKKATTDYQVGSTGKEIVVYFRNREVIYDIEAIVKDAIMKILKAQAEEKP